MENNLQETKQNNLQEKKTGGALANFGTSQRTMIELANNYCEVFNVENLDEQTELKKLALNYANKLMTTKSKTGQVAFECCTRESIQHTLFECLDKKIDLGKNQGALIVYGNQLQLQTEYFGNIAQAKKLVPYLVDIRGMIIYKNDKIDIVVENGSYKIKNHLTDFRNMRDSEIIGAYATAIYSYDGGKTEVMGECEIMTIQEIKTSWLQGRNGTSVHDKFGHEMTRKTVESRCAKHLINKASGILEVGNESDDLTTLEQLGVSEEPQEKKVVLNIQDKNKNVVIDIPQDEPQENEPENDTPFDTNFVENWRQDTQEINTQDLFENIEQPENVENENEWFEVPYGDYITNYKPTGQYESGKYNKETRTIMVRKLGELPF